MGRWYGLETLQVMKTYKKKVLKFYKLLKVPLTIVLFLILSVFAGGILANKGNISQTLDSTFEIFSSIRKESLPTPTIIPTIVPFPTNKPTPSTTQYKKAVYEDPDPVINCEHASCGVIRIKKSQCVKGGYTCCQMQDKSWHWETSNANCISAQGGSNNGGTNSTERKVQYTTTQALLTELFTVMKVKLMKLLV